MMKKAPLFLMYGMILLACQMVQATPTITTSAAATPPLSPSLTPTLGGQTYYVATNGNNGNSGSAANPWLTLQYAVDTVTPGDTILVQSGTYAGMRIGQSGTANSWMKVAAAPGANVLINTPGPDNAHDSNIELENWDGDGTVSYWIIEGLEVANAPNWGIDMRGNEDNHSHHFIIRGNNVHHNGLNSSSTGIFTGHVDDIVVEDNDSHHNGEHGIYLSNSGDRFTVRRNLLHHNANCGLHMNGDLSQGGDGTISDGLVERNTIYENGLGGCAGINMDGVTNTIIRNNLLYQNHATGIAIFQQDGAVCSHDNRVLNNTLVMASDARWAILLSATGCTNNKLYNNILYTYHAWRGVISLPAPTVAGFASDYNVVMSRFSTDDGDTVLTLAQWQALGYDTHSLIATPAQLFLNEPNNDYHLKTNSPAIDVGTTLPDVPDDWDGQPRFAGTGFDIGADEYFPLDEISLLPLLTQLP